MASASRGMNDQEVQQEMSKMVTFIKQEALEKAREIKVKADEEFNIEKAKLVRQETLNIEAFYQKKQKQAEVQKRITQSTHVNKSRLRLLQSRQQLLNQLNEEAKKKLYEISQDKGKYQALLKDLILQGMYQLMEENVSIQCRSADIPLVEAAIGDAAKTCAETLKIQVKATIDKENPLSDSSAGGVVLFGLGDRIRCANTLENRLEMLTQKMLPDMRHYSSSIEAVGRLTGA